MEKRQEFEKLNAKKGPFNALRSVKERGKTCKFGLLADKRPVSVFIFSEQWMRPFLPDTSPP
nr:hypothetical protein Iba_chr03aCG12860 [Ipomoea batatas]